MTAPGRHAGPAGVIAMVTVLVAGCAGGGEPGPSYVAPGSGSPSGAPTAPSPTPEASPLAATWATIGVQPEDTLVVIDGRVSAGGMVSCYDGACGLFLADPADSSHRVIASVPSVATAGVPDTMVELPSGYAEDDLRLTAHDGAAIRSGDMVRVTGTVGHGTSMVWVHCTRLDRASEPAPTPSPVPDTVTFKQIASLPKGTLVRIRGTLGIPWFTFCNDRICSILLEDPASTRQVSLFVPVIRGDAARRNGMLPLPSDLTHASLRVYSSTGKLLRYGARVWITGTLDNAATEKERDIEVLGIVPAS